MLDYRPDYDPTTPGLLTAVYDMMPTKKGYKVAKYPTELSGLDHSVTMNVLESTINSLFATPWLTAPGGMIFAGTDQRLFIYTRAAGFVDVSKAGGYSLVGEVSQLGEDAAAAFDMCAYGNIVIATHKTVRPQYRDATITAGATKFADLGTTCAPPKASVCASASNFVFLGDLDGQWGNLTTNVGTRDMVAWSANGDHQDWDINPFETESSWERFVDTPGPITALARFGDGIVVFKLNAMYYGRYIGGGVENSPIWDFERISDRVGCVGPRSWVDIGNKLIFVGTGDVYEFDGTRPRAITEGVWETLFKPLTTPPVLYPAAIRVGHDMGNNCVTFHSYGKTFVYSYRYQRWSNLYTAGNGGPLTGPENYDQIDIPMRTSVNDFRTVTAGAVGDLVRNTDLFDLYAAFGTAIPFQSPAPPVCRLYTRSYSTAGNFSTTARMWTGAIGDNEKVTSVDRVAPKFATVAYVDSNKPACTVYTKRNLGDAWVSRGFAYMDQESRRFDLLEITHTADNWISFEFLWGAQNDVGAVDATEVIDIGYLPKPSGTK